MKRIQFSKQALIDLQAIKRYTYSKWSSEHYIAYRDSLLDECYSLPQKTQQISFSKYKNYFYTHCLHHYVFFRITEKDVFIVRILHERQRFAKHLHVL
jgi:plasmid stabilization system protein ParE